MLMIKPIYDTGVRDELCEMCGVPAEGYSYFAADTDDRAEHINYIIGVCTFNMKGEDNTITALANAPGVEDEEAMMIMCRAVMNLMYRAGVGTVKMSEGAARSETAEKLGFRAPDMTIDLEKFYSAPCKYTENKP